MNNSATQSTALPENVAGALSYALGPVTGAIFLSLTPYNTNRKIRFHAFQSLFLGIGLVGLCVALSVVSMVMPAFVGLIISLAFMGVGFAFVALWVFMMWKTHQGGTVVLPHVGPLAQQYAERA